MKAAYKWRLQNGLYGYITDEENMGLFVYDLTVHEREYGDGTITGSPVNDSAIATVVSRLTKEQYTQLFNTFKEYISIEYPDIQLLDVTYYYNLENDECSASASSLKCSATDIVFEATAITGTPVNAVVTNVQTDPNTGEELRYRIDFTLPVGEDYDRKADKVIDATANNFAALDSNGNLKDSGKMAYDFAASAKMLRYHGQSFDLDEKRASDSASTFYFLVFNHSINSTPYSSIFTSSKPINYSDSTPTSIGDQKYALVSIYYIGNKYYINQEMTFSNI